MNYTADLNICSACGGTGQNDPAPGKYHGICLKCKGTGKHNPELKDKLTAVEMGLTDDTVGSVHKSIKIFVSRFKNERDPEIYGFMTALEDRTPVLCFEIHKNSIHCPYDSALDAPEGTETRNMQDWLARICGVRSNELLYLLTRESAVRIMSLLHEKTKSLMETINRNSEAENIDNSIAGQDPAKN